MSEKITPEIFKKLARLASLELGEEEAEYLRGELNHQLISIEVLDAISIDEQVESAAHGVPYTKENSPQPRPDVARTDKHRKAIMDQAPETEEGYFVVPDISHEELE